MAAKQLIQRAWMALVLLGGAALGCAQTVQPPKNPHGPLTIPCEGCHTTVSWKPIRAKPEFNHNTETKYPLRAMHENVACGQCHISKVFTQVGKQCADCHADIHRRQFGAACQDCHTVRGWRVGVNDVKNHFNRFPLFGAHTAVPCDSCHRQAAVGIFNGLSTECVSCHLADYQKSTAPPHLAANLPTDCASCHGFDGWQGAKFDHAAFTNFPLVGAHATLQCSQCHVGGRYAGTPVDCYSCHINDFNSAKSPNHVTAGFPHDCLTLSYASSAGKARRLITTPRRFPLTGAHITLQCSACHTNDQFASTPTACGSCHLADFQNTTNPNHALANFPTKCDTCHTTTNWQGANLITTPPSSR